MRSRVLLACLGAAGLLATIVPAAPADRDVQAAPEFVLSPEGNHLWAYDARTLAKQLVVRAVNGEDPGVEPPTGSDRRDINGQVCVSPDNAHVVTGEDTVLGGGSSRDPRIAGWGYYAIAGAAIGDITLRQVGKLAPEAGEGVGYAGNPDNFGCGYLGTDRLVTSAIGNTLPGETATGQLFLWFGPFDAGYRQEDGGFFVGEAPHCELDRTLATAGGIAVDNGDVYVAANRPDDQGNPGGVWRYRGTFPSSMAECTPEFLAANVTKTLLIPSVPGLPADPRSPTPSAVAVSPDDTLYVSSVFSGTVSEYTKGGRFVRDIYPLSPITPPTGPTGDTPFGITFTSDGALWIADLGIVVGAPVPGMGSVIRVAFDAAGNPTPLGQRVNENITFPDGVGVYRPPPSPTPD